MRRDGNYLRLDRCIHFTGIGDETCAVGIPYDTLPGPLPCIPLGVHQHCAKRELPTPEAVAASESQFLEAVNQAIEKLANGICPHCDAKMDGIRASDRCVYAEPCGHRLGMR
jgi:hypothetical protein